MIALEIPRQDPCPCSNELKYNLTTQHLAMTETTGYNATMNKARVLQMLGDECARKLQNHHFITA
jgi:hypothetical protein